MAKPLALAIVTPSAEEYRRRSLDMEPHFYESARLAYAMMLAAHGYGDISGDKQASEALSSLAEQILDEANKALAIFKHGEAVS